MGTYEDDLGLFEENEPDTKRKEIQSLYEGTFNNKLGENLLKHLHSLFVERDMYKPGMTLDQVAFRQGEASAIKKIQKELDYGRPTE